MNIRGTFTVAGIVQNANYRETVHRIALGAGLKGFVRNQDDGSVRVVAEGDPKTVRTLPAHLRIRSDRISVEKVLARYSKATGEFRSFIIDYGPDVTRGDLALIEKMDEGYHIMREMSERLDLTNRSIGSVDSHVKSMDSNIGGHFNRLDRKYDSFGRTLKTVSKDMKGMNSSLKTVSKDMKGMNSSLKTVSKDIRGVKASSAGMASDMKGMRSSMSSVATDTRALRKAAAPNRPRPKKRQAAPA